MYPWSEIIFHILNQYFRSESVAFPSVASEVVDLCRMNIKRILSEDGFSVFVVTLSVRWVAHSELNNPGGR